MSTTKKTSNKLTTTMQSDNAIVKNLTKEEIAKAQETAQDKILAFDSALEKLLNADYKIAKKNSKNEIVVQRKATKIKLCYKAQKIACYSNVSNNEMRNKLLENFKYTKDITKATNEKYLASKTSKEFQVTIKHNIADEELTKIIKQLFDNYEKCIADYNKSKKAQ